MNEQERADKQHLIYRDLPDKSRCNIIDCGAFNDIISGYIALAFKAAGVVPGTEKVNSSKFLEAYSAEDALIEHKYGGR